MIGISYEDYVERKTAIAVLSDAVKEREPLVDFLSRIEPKLVAEMKQSGIVWEMANTETKIHMLLEDILFCYRNSAAPEQKDDYIDAGGRSYNKCFKGETP